MKRLVMTIIIKLCGRFQDKNTLQKRSETASPKSNKANVSVRLFYVKQFVRKPSISALRPLKRSWIRILLLSNTTIAKNLLFPLSSFGFIFFRGSFVDVDKRKQSDIYITPPWLLLYLLSVCRSWISQKSILHD